MKGTEILNNKRMGLVRHQPCDNNNGRKHYATRGPNSTYIKAEVTLRLERSEGEREEGGS